MATLLLLALAAAPASFADGGKRLQALLLGSAEAPGPGDPDGYGRAEIRINQGRGEICFTLTAADISLATAAHIHDGPAGVPGPVVVTLAPPTSGTSTGCVIGVDRDLIQAILADPAGFYVNVHNADFPAGALRGQLAQKLTGAITGVVED